jgi:hypothetical protein
MVVFANGSDMPGFSVPTFRENCRRRQQHEAEGGNEESAHSMGARKDRGLHSSSSKSKRFADLAAPESTIDDFVEKTKEICEVDPKPAVKTAGIEAPIHERVVSLNHHEPFTLKTIHCLRSSI